MKETTYNHIEKQQGYFSSSERKWISRIIKLSELYPEDVVITCMPQENDGCICARVPQKWFKLTPPRRINMSDERKAELSERLRNMRSCQQEDDCDA